MAWSYLPHTDEDRTKMLSAIGVGSVDDLFTDDPSDIRLKGALDLPAKLSEHELAKHMLALAGSNSHNQEKICFLGAGAYDHFVPSVIDHIIRRSEFYTAYTQYQPEISQGYLQALWEYQAMICQLTGMEVANASMYDGGTAVAEAAMMASGATGRTGIVVPVSLHPHYREILGTYAIDRGYDVKTADYNGGVLDMDKLEQLIGPSTAAVIVQSPNFFGLVEDIRRAAEIAHKAGTLLIAVVDPISLGLLESPGNLGADIVVGEGQSMGMSISFGGPYLGFFAATEKLMRKMPGRIVGQTLDNRGQRGFVLTLQAREQHIRREKANSNICSNEALCALTAAVYMAAVGKQGLQDIADNCLQKSHYAQSRLEKIQGVKTYFTGPFFKEFVIQLNRPVAEVNRKLLAQGIIGGADLGMYYQEMKNCMLVCVTEKRTKQDIDLLADRLEAVL